MLTTTTAKRMYIKSITIVASGSQNIGTSEDCLAINAFIRDYLHMDDYTESLGYCNDVEHNYYGKDTETGAKYHYNQLNDHQKELFAHNSAYANEFARLNAWANANGEIIATQNSNVIVKQSNIFIGETLYANRSNIISITMLSLAAISCVEFVIFKNSKKE